MDLSIGEKIIFGALGLLIVVMLYLFFVVLPVSVVATEKCLEAGYPKSAVTWNFKRYCMNLDGTVTVKVEKL